MKRSRYLCVAISPMVSISAVVPCIMAVAASLGPAPRDLVAGPVASADQVVAYTPGSETALTDSSAALGQPDDIIGDQLGFPSVLSPFSPAFEADEIVRMQGAGAGITLRLSNYAIDVSGPELGVISNFGIADVDFPNGQAGDPAGSFSPPRQARVEVSKDGDTFISLGTFTFDLPANFYTDVDDPFSPTPGSAPADPGKPFTGSLADFNGLNFSEMKTLLDGSIGGTWIDISGAGLAKVGYVRFTTVADNGYDMALDAVLVATGATGSAVPEPTSALLLCVGAAGALMRRRG